MAKEPQTDSSYLWGMVMEIEKLPWTPEVVAGSNRLRRIAYRMAALELMEKRLQQAKFTKNWKPPTTGT